MLITGWQPLVLRTDPDLHKVERFLIAVIELAMGDSGAGGHAEGRSRTSALPPIADIQSMISGQAPANVRFAPKSGH